MNTKEKQLLVQSKTNQDEDDIKDRRIDDVLVNLYTYIYFLEVLIENNQRSDARLCT